MNSTPFRQQLQAVRMPESFPVHNISKSKCKRKQCSSDRPIQAVFSNKCMAELCSSDRPFTLLLATGARENKVPVVSSLARLNKPIVYIIKRIAVYIFVFLLRPILMSCYSCFTLAFCYTFLHMTALQNFFFTFCVIPFISSYLLFFSFFVLLIYVSSLFTSVLTCFYYLIRSTDTQVKKNIPYPLHSE